MRDTDATKRYRPSAAELKLDARVQQLGQTLHQFSMRVRSVLPGVGELDMGQYYSQLPVYGNYLSDEDMLNGYGPRFVAKYHLARSDAERQALLDTLPATGNYGSSFWTDLPLLTGHWEFGHFDRMLGDIVSPIWANWLEGVKVDSSIREALDLPWNQIPQLEVQADDTVQVPAGVELIRYKTSEREGTDGWRNKVTIPAKEKLLALVGIPELSAYVVIEHLHMNFSSHRSRDIPRIEGCIWWNQHELCWNSTGPNFDRKYHEYVVRQYLAATGMPELNYVSDEEMRTMGEALLAHLQANEAWYAEALKYQGKVKSTKVSLPGVWELNFSRSSYSNDATMSPLFGNVDPNYPKHWDVAYNFNKHNVAPLYALSDDGFNYLRATLPISPYKRREVIDAVMQFINADPEALVIVHEPRDTTFDDD
ncbi:hypothetical protein LUCX_314 [Xanthomonas phage vB_XciM_LucasX]|nr:hypothetical protein LUCX_314 [Xanthomonas phage vB_XciM_LucasX]